MEYQTDLIGFRRVTMDDMPLLARWLAMPHVARWWKESARLEDVTAKYAPCLTGEDPTDLYLTLCEGRPVGCIQTYLIGDHPEYALALDLDPGETAAGLDVYIGEPEHLYRGLGPKVILRFLRQVVFSNPEVTCCVLGPDPANLSAIRAYEKCGFRYLKTVEVPGEPAPEYLMRVGCDNPDA